MRRIVGDSAWSRFARFWSTLPLTLITHGSREWTLEVFVEFASTKPPRLQDPTNASDVAKMVQYNLITNTVDRVYGDEREEFVKALNALRVGLRNTCTSEKVSELGLSVSEIFEDMCTRDRLASLHIFHIKEGISMILNDASVTYEQVRTSSLGDTSDKNGSS